LLLIPTSNVDLHNHPPQQNTKKSSAVSIPSRHVFFTSCRVVAARHTRFVCLWLLCHLSAPCCHFLSRRIATPRHCAALCLSSSLSSRCHRVVALSRRRIVASSRRPVLSRLVVVSRPLTHLVTPALFDCCVVVLHLVVTACLSQRVNLSSRRTMPTSTPSLLIFRRCRRGPAPPLPSVATQHTSPNAIAPPTCGVIVMLIQHRHGI
jgi:hypothetical protein